MAGGYPPSQIEFVKKFGIDKALHNFDGVVLGQSAGAMNLSKLVYNYPEEIEDAFQLYDDIQQIVVQGYTTKDDATSEEIEALIYPSDAVYEELNIKREESYNAPEVMERIQSAVSKVNKTLQPYARITRITILENELEMTTTKKIKRNYKK